MSTRTQVHNDTGYAKMLSALNEICPGLSKSKSQTATKTTPHLQPSCSPKSDRLEENPVSPYVSVRSPEATSSSSAKLPNPRGAILQVEAHTYRTTLTSKSVGIRSSSKGPTPRDLDNLSTKLASLSIYDINTSIARYYTRDKETSIHDKCSGKTKIVPRDQSLPARKLLSWEGFGHLPRSFNVRSNFSTLDQPTLQPFLCTGIGKVPSGVRVAICLIPRSFDFQCRFGTLYESTPQPFLRTGLAKVPPEVRVAIWKLVVFATTAGQPVKIRPLDQRRSISSIEPAQQGSSTNLRQSDKIFSTVEKREVYYFPLLLTCRLMYIEAFPIFYANTTFHITHTSILLEFLQRIGSNARKEIRSLRMGGLACYKPNYSEDELQDIVRRLGADARPLFESMLSPDHNPNYVIAGNLLGTCEHLTRVSLDMLVGEENEYIYYLTRGRRRIVIDFVDACHWIVRPAQAKEYDTWERNRPWQQARPDDGVWGDDTWKSDRYVQVDIRTLRANR